MAIVQALKVETSITPFYVSHTVYYNYIQVTVVSIHFSEKTLARYV